MSNLILLVPGLFLSACDGGQGGPLPILGNKYTLSGDTVFHEIADFRFVNQDSQRVTNATFQDKVYVADLIPYSFLIWSMNTMRWSPTLMRAQWKSITRSTMQDTSASSTQR